jgi:acyl dehydratase
MFFEDFRVGMRFTAGPRRVSTDDIGAYARLSGDDHPLHVDPGHAATTSFGSVIAHGGLGSAVAAGLWVRTGAVADSVVAALGESWTWHAPIRPDASLTLTSVIVRLAASSGGSSGVLTRHNELTDADGTVVQSGTSEVLVRAKETAQDDPRTAVGTLEWGRRLAEVLGRDDAFQASVAEWDGTLGLRSGGSEVHLRLYRGRVIEATRRAPHGPTFTFGAPARTWVDLLLDDDPHFGVRLMRGDFQVSGDPYEYLRLTKALSLVVDGARTLAAGALSDTHHRTTLDADTTGDVSTDHSHPRAVAGGATNGASA